MAKKTRTGYQTAGSTDGLKKDLKPLGGSKAPHVWLTPAQMEERYGLSKTYWYLLRKDEIGPPFRPMGYRTVLYREDLVEEWLAQGLVKSISDPKYREMAATRKASKAGAKERASKRAKAQPKPQPATFADVCLYQRRVSRSANRPRIFRGVLDPVALTGPRTCSLVAQALVGKFCKPLPTAPVPHAVFLKEVTARQGAGGIPCSKTLHWNDHLGGRLTTN